MPTQLHLNENTEIKLRVLVADPTVQMREIIRNILLHNIGIDEVVDASDGEQVLEIFQNSPCDLLILDTAMRPLGGVELARRIRNNEEDINPFTPIIIISDHPQKNEVMGARDAGATEYLAKPLSAKILDLRIRALVQHPRPYIKSKSFFGPDRRRHIPNGTKNDERRVHTPNIVKEKT